MLKFVAERSGLFQVDIVHYVVNAFSAKLAGSRRPESCKGMASREEGVLESTSDIASSVACNFSTR